MARSRMIKPEFWDDEKLAKISRDARLLFIGLWNQADDYGVVKGNATWLKNHIFPYEDSLSTQAFKKWITELENGKWILPFDDNGERFYYIRNFTKHQTINRPSKQRNAIPPDTLIEDSVSGNGVLMDETETETETEGNNALPKKPNKKPNGRYPPPSLEEVTDYFRSKGYSDEAAKKAYEYYEAGKDPESGNWKDARGNIVKAWKQKMHSVWFKPENEVIKQPRKERVAF